MPSWLAVSDQITGKSCQHPQNGSLAETQQQATQGIYRKTLKTLFLGVVLVQSPLILVILCAWLWIIFVPPTPSLNITFGPSYLIGAFLRETEQALLSKHKFRCSTMHASFPHISLPDLSVLLKPSVFTQKLSTSIFSPIFSLIFQRNLLGRFSNPHVITNQQKQKGINYETLILFGKRPSEFSPYSEIHFISS